jgi:hypothetical protein
MLWQQLDKVNFGASWVQARLSRQCSCTLVHSQVRQLGTSLFPLPFWTTMDRCVLYPTIFACGALASEGGERRFTCVYSSASVLRLPVCSVALPRCLKLCGASDVQAPEYLRRVLHLWTVCMGPVFLVIIINHIWQASQGTEVVNFHKANMAMY